MELVYIKKKLTIGILCLSSIVGICQKGKITGYIVNQAGDSIKGYFPDKKWDKNPTKINFSTSASGNYTVYEPQQIKGFSIGDERYVSAFVDVDISSNKIVYMLESKEPTFKRDWVFLQILITGSKSLYFLKPEGDKVLFYIEDGGIKPLVYKKYVLNVQVNPGQYESRVAENNKYLGQLVAYLDGYPDVKSKIKHINYGVKSLTNLFAAYYEWTNETNSGIQSRKELKLNVGLSMGVCVTHFDVNAIFKHPLAHSTFNTSTNPTMGIYVDTHFLRTKNLELTTELNFTSFKINGSGFFYLDGDTEPITSSFNYRHLSMNNIFKYALGKQGIFILGTGITTGLQIKDNVQIESPVSIDFSKRGFELGYAGSAEVRIKRIGVEFRYTKSSGVSKETNMSAKLDRFFLLARIRLSK